MKYRVELKTRAMKDLKSLPRFDSVRIADALEALRDDLSGDVKKLSDHSPEYRLRIGNYRALFEIVKPDLIMVYRIRHRKEAYRYAR